MSNRTILIGVDGATFDLLDEWLESGALPNFTAIAHSGCSGVLESTIPTKSVPAWPSFNSGKNPGRHGLLAFDRDLEYDDSTLIDQTNLRSPRFWDVLAEDGIDSGTVGGVLTYPPRNVDGVTEVSGPMAPDDAEVFTAPESLTDEIRDLVPEYSFGPPLAGDRQATEDACLQAVSNRATVSKHLMQNTEWQFFFTLFIAPDRAQHKLWETPERIRHVYESIDEFIGWARTEYPDANFVIVSDHGFTEPPDRDFFVNAWLSEVVGESQTRSPSRRYKVAKTVYTKLRQTFGVNLRALVPRQVEAWFTATEDDDSNESPAIFGVGYPVDGIHVDDALPEYDATVDEIVAAARDLTDPETGHEVFKNVWRAEERYEGQYLDALPDIVLLPHSEYHVNGNPHSKVFDTYSGMENEAAHGAAPEGVFMMSGPDVATQPDRMAASILDIPPTVLQIFGSEIPTDFDGRVITEALDDEVVSEIAYRDPIAHETDTEAQSGDRSDVEDRLEDLGYL